MTFSYSKARLFFDAEKLSYRLLDRIFRQPVGMISCLGWLWRDNSPGGHLVGACRHYPNPSWSDTLVVKSMHAGTSVRYLHAILAEARDASGHGL